MLNAGMFCLLVALRIPASDAAGTESCDEKRWDLLSLLDTEEVESAKPRAPALVPALEAEFPRLSLQSSLAHPAQRLRATRDDDGAWVAAGAVGGALVGLPVGAVVTAAHAAPGVAASVALTSMVVGGVGGYLLGDLARNGSLFAKICVITLDAAVSVWLLAILPYTLGEPNSRSVGQRVGV
jgi:hypothetical protein